MATLGDALVERPLLDRTIVSTARERLIVAAPPPPPSARGQGPAARTRSQSRQSSSQASQQSYATDSSASASASQLASQRSRRSAGAQALLAVVPNAVKEWDTFFDDVEIDHNASAILDIAVADGYFPTVSPTAEIDNEAGALLLMHDAFMQTLRSFIFRSPEFGFSTMGIQTCSESGNASFRTDIGWTRNDTHTREYPERFGTLWKPTLPYTHYFLVHEHKSPFVFPYMLTLTEQRSRILAEFSAQNNNAHPDDEEFMHAIADSLERDIDEDLVTFWTTTRNNTSLSPEKKQDVLYPILQIYAYMLRTFCKYGVLSTTDKTWFFKLTPDNTLLITRPFIGTETGVRNSVKYAYFSVIIKALEDARLDVNDASLRSLGGNVRLNLRGSAWAHVYRSILTLRPDRGRGFPTPGSSQNSHSGAQDAIESDAAVADVANVTDAIGASALTGPIPQQQQLPTQVEKEQLPTKVEKERAEEVLRKELPLPAEGFTYHGGLVDVVKEYPEDFFGRTLRVCTRGVDTVIKVMRQLRKYGDPSEHDEWLDAEEAQLEGAFAGAMDAYEVLRSIQGKHVPWFLYGGSHIMGDLILATTYEGRPLAEMPDKSLRAPATKAKARAALDAVHAFGVAHCAIDLWAFAMDDAGEVRLVNFLNSATDATQDEIAADNVALEKAFFNT